MQKVEHVQFSAICRPEAIFFIHKKQLLAKNVQLVTGVASYAALGNVPILDFQVQLFNYCHFTAAQTLTLDSTTSTYVV